MYTLAILYFIVCILVLVFDREEYSYTDIIIIISGLIIGPLVLAYLSTVEISTIACITIIIILLTFCCIFYSENVSNL